jgi:hypothetical protein
MRTTISLILLLTTSLAQDDQIKKAEVTATKPEHYRGWLGALIYSTHPAWLQLLDSPASCFCPARNGRNR